MVLGQYQPFWWNSFSLFGYVEDSPFWIVSDHFGRLKSANLGWSSCLNEFVSLVGTSKWPFYCGKWDITLITRSQFEIYRYLFCVRSPWKSRMVDSSMTKIMPIADLRGKSCGPANSNCPVDHLVDLVSRWSFGRSPGVDSRIPAGSGLCDIRSIPGLQSYSSLPCQDLAAWGTVWLIFDMVNFACTTLMSFEFSQGRSSAIQQMQHGCCFLLFLSS